jgi:hypothetical protein
MQSPSLPTQPMAVNRLGFGCLMLFALPFAGGGLLALVAGIHDYPAKPGAIVAIIMGGLFVAIGILLVVGAWYAKSAADKTAAQKTAYPDKPWMWRTDWASGVIADANKAGTIGFWIFAIIWSAVAIPVAFLATPQLRDEPWLALLVGLFPLAGVIMLISAVYLTIRSMKFGTSKCHLERVPIVPGRLFRGEIELNADLVPESGVRLRLLSIHKVTTRRGRNRSTTEHLLWDEEVVVEQAAAMRSPMGTRIPFQFATPPDAHVTDERDTYSSFIWRLAATAEVPGVDYAAQFELPVFQSGEIADGSEFAAFEQRHRAEAARHRIEPSSGVEVRVLPNGGEEFRTHAVRTAGGMLRSLLIIAIWNAAIVAMFHFQAPWGFPALFIVIDLLLLAASIDYFLGQSTITVDPAGVRARKEWLGAGSTSSYEASAIQSIDGTAPSPNSKTFGVTLKLRDGSTHLLTAYLPDREVADTVAAKMMADLKRGMS